MRRKKQQSNKAFDNLIKITLSAFANQVFDKAQELAPEGSSGNLKKSGTVSVSSTDFTISYSAPYASEVYHGSGIESDYIQTPKDHDRTYKNPIGRGEYKGKSSRPVSYPRGRNFGKKRIVKWEGSPRGWYTTDQAREGNPWIDRALSEVLGGLSPLHKKLLKSMGFNLEAKFTFT